MQFSISDLESCVIDNGGEAVFWSGRAIVIKHTWTQRRAKTNSSNGLLFKLAVTAV